MPPGTGGLTPALSLAYSSRNRTEPSWVGAGWSLQGIPSIQRTLRFGVPAYDATDTFVYGGQDLVDVGGGEFRTEQESFQRIVKNGSSWTVLQKDGTQLRFGTSAQSRVAGPDGSLEWMLEEVEDARGNIVRFTYTNAGDAGVLYPDVIEYTIRRDTGSDVLVGNRRIEFIHEPATRPDVSTSYAAGFLQRRTKLLGAIRIDVDGETFRRYELEYRTSHDSFRSLLTEVREFGADWESSEPTPPLKTTFDYTSNYDHSGNPVSTGWAADPTWSWPSNVYFVTGNLSRSGGTRLLDVNRDGLPDLVRSLRVWNGNTYQSASGNGIYLNTGSGFSPSPDPGMTEPGIALGFHVCGSCGKHRRSGAAAADWNGDGYPDIFWPRLNDSDSLRKDRFSFGSAAGFSATSSSTGPADSYGTSIFYPFAAGQSAEFDGNVDVADMDGDGLPDLVVRGIISNPFSPGPTVDYTLLNLGDGTFPNPPPVTIETETGGDIVQGATFQSCSLTTVRSNGWIIPNWDCIDRVIRVQAIGSYTPPDWYMAIYATYGNPTSI